MCIRDRTYPSTSSEPRDRGPSDRRLTLEVLYVMYVMYITYITYNTSSVSLLSLGPLSRGSKEVLGYVRESLKGTMSPRPAHPGPSGGFGGFGGPSRSQPQAPGPRSRPEQASGSNDAVPLCGRRPDMRRRSRTPPTARLR